MKFLIRHTIDKIKPLIALIFAIYMKLKVNSVFKHLGFENKSVFLTSILATSILAGCGVNPAVTVSEQDRMTQSGFLTNYKALKEVKGLEGIQCWNVPELNAKNYTKILISPITISLAPPKDKTDPSKPASATNSQSTPQAAATTSQPGTSMPSQPASGDAVDPKDIKMLSDYFENDLKTALKKQMDVVDTPTPGTVVLRIALTDLKPTSVVGSVIGTATPFGYVAEIGSGPVTGRPAGSTPYMGETGMELQFVDGMSKRILAECRDTEIGRKYAADMNNGAAGAAQAWANGYFNSFQTWMYAKDAFDKWTLVLNERIAKLRGVELKPQSTSTTPATPKN